MRVPYPRTPHLPWSPGVASDDVRVSDLSELLGREVVVTEKLDGENTTLYRDGLHARSLDSAHHPSRAWIKALHGRIAAGVPSGWRICGENVYARHSIGYQNLERWFYAFSVWAGDRCLDWDRTVRFTRRLGLPVPPVLWRGTFDERTLRTLPLDPARQEGYVVRTVAGFPHHAFGRRVAKWVRRHHVRTDEHWMLAPVVENGLGPHAPLWEVRSGGSVDVPRLLAASGMTGTDLRTARGPGAIEPTTVDDDTGTEAAAVDRAEAAVADVGARLALLGRGGDLRLAGVLAALFHGSPRTWLAARLVARVGMPPARRVADLVGLHPGLQRRFPDEERRAGLVRLAVAADLGILHAVAAAVLAGRTDDASAQAREQVAWSELHADEAELLGAAPLEPLRAELRSALRDYAPDVADRCWAETREAYAQGRIRTPREAPAASWRWRSGDFPRLVMLVGPSGSGKTTVARGLPGVDAVVSLDDLRQARGSRADQRANAAVLREGLHRLDRRLADGGTTVWDATGLNRQQRSLVHTVARRRDALTTHAVLLVPEDVLVRRNAGRAHPVPSEVLAAQLRRFWPPYPGDAHRTWYIGPEGTVADVAGTLSDDLETRAFAPDDRAEVDIDTDDAPGDVRPGESGDLRPGGAGTRAVAAGSPSGAALAASADGVA
ncbi:AAA family ATPase [Plantactinospora sp. S1510]|uniref:AAA family ATPase n=1 Tax=Plantactinospora alkalitolerans TaxID=2789879 RepID=A0ABS0GTQ5_9ACTN|nr:RNA ligase family protein [Plantactinospora alkalitolerans]MBF9129566.1 AAA family ATPase [Plantactinospora alkalitolerans]